MVEWREVYDSFKFIFLNASCCISIPIMSEGFALGALVNHKSANITIHNNVTVNVTDVHMVESFYTV